MIYRATGRNEMGSLLWHLFAVLVLMPTGLLGGREALACDAPIYPVGITQVTLAPDGSGSPVLHLEDPNPATEVTGYDIYRDALPSLGKAAWSALAMDAGDEDPATPGIQWSDTTGDSSATGIWYYLAAPYHAPCAVEGPWRSLGVRDGGDAADAAPGDGVCASVDGACTLRAAIQEANALDGKEEILLTDGSHVLGLAGPGEDAAATGDLDVTAPLVLRGAAARSTLIDAQGLDRVFHVLPGVEAVFEGVNIQSGDAILGGGMLVEDGADVRLIAVAINGNHSSGDGGGVAVTPLGVLSIERSTLSHNVAEENGGGLDAEGTVAVQDSTLGWNAAVGGAAGGGGGGGIHVGPDGIVTMSHATLADNRAAMGGGIDAISGSLEIARSIIARSHQGDDCAGIVQSLGYNLAGDLSCDLTGPGDIQGEDPGLAPLLVYGDRLMRTYPPLDDSPAIDAADACVGTDQVLQPRSELCTIGAVEYLPGIMLIVPGFLYVGDRPFGPPSGDMSKLAASTNNVLATYPLADLWDMAPHPDGQSLYMINNASFGSYDYPLVFDRIHNTAAAIAQFLDLENVALTPSGARAYVTDRYNGGVQPPVGFVRVINTATNLVTNTITVGWGPYGVAVHPFGYKAYVVNSFDETISVIWTAGDYVISTIPAGAGPFEVVFHPDGSRAYVLNSDGTISVLNGFTDQIIDTIVLPVLPSFCCSGDVAVHPDGSVLYASLASGDPNTLVEDRLYVISTASNTIIKTLVVTARRIRFHPLGTRAYFSSCSPTAPFAVMDTATHSVISTNVLEGSPCGISVGP